MTAGNLLYGPLGVTTSAGTALFLYGEFYQQTPPINLQTMQPGDPIPWNEQTIAGIYGIDINAASALRVMLRDIIYSDFVPDLLLDYGSDGPYKTQTVNEWLFGWRDPVSAMIAGDATDMSLGWSKLETNQTYYNSGGLTTGPATTYTICTGHNPDCDKGETILEDGSNELSWRNSTMFTETYRDSIPIFMIYLILVPTYSLNLGWILMASGQTKYLLKLALSMSIINVILSYWLLTTLEGDNRLLGIPFSTVLVTWISTIMVMNRSLTTIESSFLDTYPVKEMWKIASVSALSVLPVILLSAFELSNPLTLFLSIFSFAIMFLALSYKLKLIGENEIKLAKSFLPF